MKALEDFMYKGKHVKGGDEVAIDAKDVPKLRGLGKIPVPQDGPAKKKAKNTAFVPQEIKDEAIKSVERGKRKRRY